MAWIRIQPRGSPPPWARCPGAALHPGGMLLVKAEPGGEQILRASVSPPSPSPKFHRFFPHFRFIASESELDAGNGRATQSPWLQGMRRSLGKGFRQDLAPDYLQQLIVPLLFAVRCGRIEPQQTPRREVGAAPQTPKFLHPRSDRGKEGKKGQKPH